MKAFLDLMIANPTATLVVLVVLVAIGYQIYKAKLPMITMTALYIVAVAEKKWGSATGQLKYAEAYLYIRKKYPIVTLLLPKNTLNKIIEEALAKLKEMLKTQMEKQDITKAEAIEKLIQEYKDPDEEETDTE